MLLDITDTKFTKCSEVQIPDSFYNRLSVGCDDIDLMFGSEYFKGFMPGSAITITGTPGAGKCHAGDQKIEVFADGSIIEDIKNFLSTRVTGG